MARILITDPVSAKPWQAESLENEPMGGTEASIVRVACALSVRHEITIAQSGRDHTIRDEYGIHYVPYHYKSDSPSVANPDVVIVIRSGKILPRMRKLYPESRFFLWMHCFPGKHHKRLNRIALKTGCTLVAVSDTLRDYVTEFLQTYRNESQNGRVARVIRIYNPIDDGLQPGGKPFDTHKLVYFSSPHKGLARVLEIFSYVRQSFPDMRLYVANPGYVHMQPAAETEGVVNLGPLPHREVIDHVRDAFCVFYPQAGFRETFGLVFAEANAVGTPVLAHPSGAAPEVLGNPAQLIDCDNDENVTRTLGQWRVNGRPVVTANEQFRCSRVASEWEKLITGAHSVTLPQEWLPKEAEVRLYRQGYI